MSREAFEILEGALLVGDAHFSGRRPELEGFFEAIEAGGIACTQLLLMGDIFDLLFGEVAISHSRNARLIAIINAIAARVPVLYLEGNHDYNLAGLFPSVKVVPLAQQPLNCRFAAQTLYLAHGDFNQPRSYRIYTAVIRNHAVMRVLDWIDRRTGNGVVRRLDSYLNQKNDCHRIPDFCTYIRKHILPLNLPEGSTLIEGHYHQGERCRFDGLEYINLGAFACGGEYAMIIKENGTHEMTLVKKFWPAGEQTR